MTTSKGRPKKNPAKEVAKSPPKEAKIKKQNAATQEDNSKTKNNMKTAKKGNAKKAAPRGKLNAAAGKVDEAQEEEAATPEVDVKENGEIHTAEVKQKKKNTGKANAAMNGKVEAKGKQKKGQAAAASVDEKEVIKDVIAETETTEMNVTSEIEENDVEDISLSQNNTTLELKDEEDKFNDSKADLMTNESANISDTSVKETERSGTFLCF